MRWRRLFNLQNVGNKRRQRAKSTRAAVVPKRRYAGALRRLARLHDLVRVSYVKVSEYQRRGLVQLHPTIRLDKRMPTYREGEIRRPDRRFTSELLERALRATIGGIPDPEGASCRVRPRPDLIAQSAKPAGAVRCSPAGPRRVCQACC